MGRTELRRLTLTRDHELLPGTPMARSLSEFQRQRLRARLNLHLNATRPPGPGCRSDAQRDARFLERHARWWRIVQSRATQTTQTKQKRRHLCAAGPDRAYDSQGQRGPHQPEAAETKACEREGGRK